MDELDLLTGFLFGDVALHPTPTSAIEIAGFRSALSLEPAAEMAGFAPVRLFHSDLVDALPRLKRVGFGGDNDTCLLRGLTGVSRPETATRLQNVVCRVHVAAFHVSATIADKGPHV
jgi:hypothetical protein